MLHFAARVSIEHSPRSGSLSPVSLVSCRLHSASTSQRHVRSSATAGCFLRACACAAARQETQRQTRMRTRMRTRMPTLTQTLRARTARSAHSLTSGRIKFTWLPAGMSDGSCVPPLLLEGDLEGDLEDGFSIRPDLDSGTASPRSLGLSSLYLIINLAPPMLTASAIARKYCRSTNRPVACPPCRPSTVGSMTSRLA